MNINRKERDSDSEHHKDQYEDTVNGPGEWAYGGH